MAQINGMVGPYTDPTRPGKTFYKFTKPLPKIGNFPEDPNPTPRFYFPNWMANRPLYYKIVGNFEQTTAEVKTGQFRVCKSIAGFINIYVENNNISRNAIEWLEPVANYYSATTWFMDVQDGTYTGYEKIYGYVEIGWDSIDPRAPVADFTWNPDLPFVNQDITLIDQSGGGAPSWWKWKVCTFATNPIEYDCRFATAVYDFDEYGGYIPVVLEVGNQYGVSAIDKYIEVSNIQPNDRPRFIYEQGGGCGTIRSNKQVNFEIDYEWYNGEPNDQEVYGYWWDFGDGSAMAFASGDTIQHVFPSFMVCPDYYTVTSYVQVENNFLIEQMYDKEVRVYGIHPDLLKGMIFGLMRD